MKIFEVKAVILATGETVTISGTWENWREMTDELRNDGYIVTWWNEVA